VRDRRLLAFAKEMRREPTPAEQRLWYHLRAKRFDNLKFRHQTVIGFYIGDFTCRSKMLVIEVDGDTHTDPDADRIRTMHMNHRSWRVLRFTNADVMDNIEGVLLTIRAATAPSPDLATLGHPLP